MIAKIYSESDGFAVWLEPEAEDKHLGLCIGFGSSRELALKDGFYNMGNATAQLVILERQALREMAIEELEAKSK